MSWSISSILGFLSFTVPSLYLEKIEEMSEFIATDELKKKHKINAKKLSHKAGVEPCIINNSFADEIYYEHSSSYAHTSGGR